MYNTGYRTLPKSQFMRIVVIQIRGRFKFLVTLFIYYYFNLSTGTLNHLGWFDDDIFLIPLCA